MQNNWSNFPQFKCKLSICCMEWFMMSVILLITRNYRKWFLVCYFAKERNQNVVFFFLVPCGTKMIERKIYVFWSQTNSMLALCFRVVRLPIHPSHSCECDVSITPWGNFSKLGTWWTFNFGGLGVKGQVHCDLECRKWFFLKEWLSLLHEIVQCTIL